MLWSVAMPELFLVGSVVANMPPGKFSTESESAPTCNAEPHKYTDVEIYKYKFTSYDVYTGI